MSLPLKTMALVFFASLSASAAGNIKIPVCHLEQTNSHGIESEIPGSRIKLEFGSGAIQANVSSGLKNEIYPVTVEISRVDVEAQTYGVDFYYNAGAYYSRTTQKMSFPNGTEAPSDVQAFTKAVTDPNLNERMGAILSQRIAGLKIPFSMEVNLTNGIKAEYPARVKLICK